MSEKIVIKSKQNQLLLDLLCDKKIRTNFCRGFFSLVKGFAKLVLQYQKLKYLKKKRYEPTFS